MVHIFYEGNRHRGALTYILQLEKLKNSMSKMTKALLLYNTIMSVRPDLKSAGGLFISTVVIFKEIVFNSASRYRSIKYS